MLPENLNKKLNRIFVTYKKPQIFTKWECVNKRLIEKSSYIYKNTSKISSVHQKICTVIPPSLRGNFTGDRPSPHNLGTAK